MAADMSNEDNGKQWKCGNEFLPYHPAASHVSPDYRDGWNHCYRASLAASAGSEPVAWMDDGKQVSGGAGELVYRVATTRSKTSMPSATAAAFHIPLYTHPSPPEGMVGGWISVDERLPELYKRVLVITTDCDDEPCAALAHYNGPGKFLATGGHRLVVATHWQEIEAPPAGWKLPPAKPRVSHRRKPAPPIAAGGGKDAGHE